MLKKFLSSIVKVASAAGRKRLATLKNPLLVRFVPISITTSEETLLALLDGDDANEAQVLGIVRRQTVRLIEEGAEIGKEKLLTFNDLQLANAIIAYLNGGMEVLKALLDANPNNEAQILEIWKRRRKELAGETLDLVTDKLDEIIRKKIKDPTLANVVIEMLESLDLLVKEPASTNP